MFEHNTAYRFSDNTVEGFTGIGFTEKSAEENAIQKIKNKLELITKGENAKPFDESRLITSHDQCTQSEQERIGKDWKISRKSKIL